MGAMVFQFGLRPPTEGADLVRQQLWLAHVYYNLLMRLMRIRRDVERALDLSVRSIELESRFVEALAELTRVLAILKTERAATRSRSESKEVREAVKEARAAFKVAQDALYDDWLANRRGPLKEQMAAIYGRWKQIRNDGARKESGLRHGTYTRVENSVEQACDSTFPWDGIEPKDPKFHRWDGSGSIGTQVYGGAFPCELVRDTRVQIEPVEDRFASEVDDRGGGKHRPQFALLKLRVGSTGKGNRQPVWAVFPMRMHRPLPPDAVVTWAYVSCRREGPRELWSCEITIDAVPVAMRQGRGVVSLDIGWLKVPDGLQVCAWRDTEGNHGTLVLDRRMLGALRLPAELRSVRDKKLDVLRARFCTWRDQIIDKAPEWWRDEVSNIGQWKSPARFAALWRRWSEQRWAGDKRGFTMLAGWRYRDHHLWDWQTGQMNQALRCRRDLYRVFSARMAERYSTIIVERFDRREVARIPDPELEIGEGVDAEVDVREESARAYRVLACTSSLFGPKTGGCLRSTASSRGTEVVAMNPADTTRECPDCGHVYSWDAAAYRDRTPPCPKCSCERDQDDGACAVMLRRYMAKKPNGGGSAPKESKWKRIARQAAEAKAKKDLPPPPASGERLCGTGKPAGAHRGNKLSKVGRHAAVKRKRVSKKNRQRSVAARKTGGKAA